MTKIFKIEGKGLMTLFIEANSFDDALFQAKLINKDYYCGRVANDVEIYEFYNMKGDK